MPTHLTYLILELGWALPVLTLQWAVGHVLLWRKRAILLLGALFPTLYLSVADHLAIGSGIWLLHPSRLLGIYVGNVPVEEIIFFLVTNLMVVQTVLLVGAGPIRPRASLSLQRRSE